MRPQLVTFEEQRAEILGGKLDQLIAEQILAQEAKRRLAPARRSYFARDGERG